VKVLTEGALQTTYDAAGSYHVLQKSLLVLDRLGRHLQIGLLPGAAPMGTLSLGRLISHELELVGCHGISRTSYNQLMNFLALHQLDPAQMVHSHISLAESVDDFTNMHNQSHDAGVTMIQF